MAPLDHALLLRNAPSLFLVLAPDARFTVVEASDAYLRAANLARGKIIGRGFFEVFPEDAGGAGTTGAASTRPALERVVATRCGDGFNFPVLAVDGQLRYVMHRFDAMEPEVLRRARERDEAVRAVQEARDERDQFIDAAAAALARMGANVNRMDTILEGLLGLSRSGRSLMVRRRVDVSALARRIADQYLARHPDRTVQVDIAPGLEAWADEALLAIAIESLLSNAWKFTSLRADARIEVGMELHGSQAVFHVRDNGVGFDMAAAEKLFTPFARLHRNHEFGGHGIGLATVKRIIERHGGRIWADARAKSGATFHFTLTGLAT